MLDVAAIAKKLAKTGTGNATLTLILEHPKNADGSPGKPREYEDAKELIDHLEKSNKTGTADKVRDMNSQPKKHVRDDDQSASTDALLKRHEANAKKAKDEKEASGKN